MLHREEILFSICGKGEKLENGKLVTMSKLQVGDKVEAGHSNNNLFEFYVLVELVRTI